MRTFFVVVGLLEAAVAFVNAAPSGHEAFVNVSANIAAAMDTTAPKKITVEMPTSLLADLHGINMTETFTTAIVMADASDKLKFNYLVANIEEPGVLTQAGSVKCETSSASPTFEEIQGCAAKLEARKKTCMQSNRYGSRCTRLEHYKGGDVSLCGEHKAMVHCHDLSWVVKEIMFRCANYDFHRAGGTYAFAGNAPLKGVVH
ncbi:hypothetical protein BZA05DRAFT_445626 [Tricharina praecox]|uniref:uncharacterized protein n=1 Tax=Tricharina praecox TaxID=43433 RepID=UPI0022209633|nr:uncharacterized protein BZA05DRAFT_445626 [Tricharina praecox]KAI5850788.1 hypothetical protein BZA05DRAFT_445626 [Tricharina praecox]